MKRTREGSIQAPLEFSVFNRQHFESYDGEYLRNYPTNPDISALRHVAEVQSAITTGKRISALKKLHHAIVAEIQNNDEIKPFISKLIDAGILNVLFLQLNVVLHRDGSTTQELKLCCSCLDMLLQCSKSEHEALLSLIQKQGDDFIRVLTLVLESLRNSKYYCFHVNNTSDSEGIHKYIMSIGHTISATSAGSSLIFQNQAYLFEVVDYLRVGNEVFDFDAGQEALGTIKNLTYYEECGRRDMLLMEDFLPTLISLPHRLILQPMRPFAPFGDKNGVSNGRPRNVLKSPLLRLSAIFRNLAISSECRSILARQPDFLSALLNLLTLGEESMDSSSTQQPLLRNVLHTLISLAMDSHDSACLILLHDDGMILRFLKRFLKSNLVSKLQDNEQIPRPAMLDPVVRKRSARVLRLLINDGTGHFIIHDREFLTAVSEAALHDSSFEVRSEAAEAFAKCAGLIVAQTGESVSQKRPQKYHEAILDALTALYVSAFEQNEDQRKPASVSLAALARAFKEQASHVENRVEIAKRGDLITKAAGIALLTQDNTVDSLPHFAAIEDTCCAIMYLSMEKRNRQPLCRMPIVLKALVRNANSESALHLSDFPRNNSNSPHSRSALIRKFCIEAILNFASDETNITTMAHYPGLLSCLLQCAKLVSADVENSLPNQLGNLSKARIKKTILILAKQL